MSLRRIFETDPNAKPKPRFTNDFVGRFRSGMSINNRPVSLANWRVTTDDPDTADALAELMGGRPEEWETSGTDGMQVLTDKDSVEIVVDGSKAIRSRMILWGRQGPIHECDGVEFLSPEEEKGKPCGCPALLVDRKAAAKTGRGPAPSVEVAFRLAEDQELGRFRFVSSSWELVKVLHEVEDALDRVNGPALCRLSLELVEFVTKDGKPVSFRKPVIKVIKAFDDAIADAPHTDYSLTKWGQGEEAPF
ncbi:hypothetical protein OG401_23910 [Kitasatospora purpeofusca]|uniref:recombination directionality factor n=1 Tax=Kitasatospora purpeofusca TaxID=67352 RepID=UPI0022505479|nr:hypothetical protein [Kitasatospora purpeofusca]MCX4687310.1 hypothetical protein [Kitasatospora purpeofusca]